MTTENPQTVVAIEAGRKAVGDAPGWEGKLNIYVCEVCRGHIVTKDMAAGVTPFLIDCRATRACKGMMKSSMYSVFDQRMREDYVWTLPEPTEKLDPWMIAHVTMGGPGPAGATVVIRPVEYRKVDVRKMTVELLNANGAFGWRLRLAPGPHRADGQP